MKSVIFFGELPPKTIHGASISNEINLSILRTSFNVTTVEEFSDLRYHNQFSFKKLRSFLSAWYCFFKKVLLKRYEYFYGIIYLSFFGICKNILSVVWFKLTNPWSTVILHFHRSDIEIFLSKRIHRVLFRVLKLFVSKFIILSETQLVLSNYVHKDRLFVLLNTIEQEYDLSALKSLEKEPGSFILLYIGNYIREKGILEVLDAVNLINSYNVNKVHLHCYGNYTNKHIEDTIKKKVLNNPFIVLNNSVTGKKKFEIIYNANAMILPSYNEGLPLVLLESMYLGTPAIISNVGFINDALGESYSFYCQPGNVNSIADCITKLQRNNDNDSLSDELKFKYKRYSHFNHSKQLLTIFQ